MSDKNTTKEIKSDPTSQKVAFYPCCGNDFEAPVKILRNYANSIIFCDNDPQRHSQFLAFKKTSKYSSEINLKFINIDARKAIENIERIDVLFYRCDSIGEGGSRVLIFAEPLFQQIVEKMPSSKGIIITDGSNCWPKTFKRMIRGHGTIRYGWRVKLEKHAPIKTRRGDLWVLSVASEKEGGKTL